MEYHADHTAANRALAELDRKRFIDLASAYRSICQTASDTLCVERVSIWQVVDAGEGLQCVHDYGVETGHQRGEVSLRTDDYPMYVSALRDKRIVQAEHARSHPSTRELVGYLSEQGVQSLLDIPIRKDGELIGVLCMEQQAKPRRWGAAETLIAASLGDQLAKRMSEDERVSVLRDGNRFRGLVEKAPFAALLVNPHGKVEYANGATSQLFGLPEVGSAEVATLSTLFDAPERDRIVQEAYVATLQGTVWQDICDVRSHDGRVVPASVMVYRQGEAFEADHVLAILIRPVLDEITDKYSTPADGASNYMAVIDQLWEALVLLEPTTLQVLEANETALQLLGYADDELKKMTIYDLASIAPEEIDAHVQRLEEVGSYVLDEDTHILHKNGDAVLVAAKVASIDVEGNSYICLFLRDQSEQEAFRNEMEQFFFYNPATGLPSPHLLRERGEQILATAAQGESKVGLVTLRVGQYLEMSDLLGAEEIEHFERQFADRLRVVAEGADLIAHTEENAEFAIVDSRLQDEAALERYLEEIQAAFASPIAIGDQELPVELAYGAALFPSDAANIRELARHASIACRHARENGASHALYNPAHKSRFRNRALLEQQLRKGLDNGDLSLVYQPVVEAKDPDRMFKAEALVRWTHPHEGPISPADFIPIAEASGLMPVLDRYVLHRALQGLADWGQNQPDVGVAINLSVQTLSRPDTVELVKKALQESGIAPQRLHLEVTESAAMTNWQGVEWCMRELNAHGVGFALDDFGTGYSSLAYLKRLPTQILKIDREFVDGITRDARDESTIRAIIALAREYRLRIVAEGVEVEEQLRWLQNEGVDLIQGFLIARPQSASDLRSWAAARSESQSIYRVAGQS